MRRCAKCKTHKAESEFSRDRKRSDGLYPTCKKCVMKYLKKYRQKPEVRQLEKQYQLRWSRRPKRKKQIREYNHRQAHPNGIKNNRKMAMAWKYGITVDAYDAMYRGQNGCCATCGNPFKEHKEAQVDHCHDSGIVRGLLCANCNRALGMVKDNAEILERMTQYLRRNE